MEQTGSAAPAWSRDVLFAAGVRRVPHGIPPEIRTLRTLQKRWSTLRNGWCHVQALLSNWYVGAAERLGPTAEETQ